MIRNMLLAFSTAAASCCSSTTFVLAAPIVGATVTANTPVNFNAASGVAILTDGTIGGNNWLGSPQTSLGWLDSGWNIDTALSNDTGAPQPQLTFDLGDLYRVNSVTVSYTIDHMAGDPTRNLRAPDSMTASFSTGGDGGPFFNPVTQLSWDDSDDAGDATAAGEGVTRSLTTNLGGIAANSIRLDFLTDAEWLFVSEISFDGQVVPEPASLGLLALGTFMGFSGRGQRMRQ